MTTDAGATPAERVPGAPQGGQNCGACAAHWHVIATERAAERLAKQSIIELGFSVCLPMIRRRLPATASRPARNDFIPAFTGYLFAAWLPGADWPRIRRARGVDSILPSAGADTPATLPTAFMAGLRSRMDADDVLEDLSVPALLPALSAGDWIRITRGPMAGMLAIIEWSSEERVALLLEVLGGERRTKMRRDHVQQVENPL